MSTHFDTINMPFGKMTSSEFPGVALPAPSSTGWEWGWVSVNRKHIPMPYMGFYWGMPADSLCLLSEPKPKRTFGPLDPRPRDGSAWDDSQVQTMVGILRERHERVKNTYPLIRPHTWEDLYYYFDAVDLWHNGAWNLWQALHRMCDEDEGAPLGQMEKDVIEEWVYAWCTHEKNRERLGRWDGTGDVLTVLSRADVESVRGSRWEALEFLRGALRYWFGPYKVPEPAVVVKKVAKGMFSSSFVASSHPASFPLSVMVFSSRPSFSSPSHHISFPSRHLFFLPVILLSPCPPPFPLLPPILSSRPSSRFLFRHHFFSSSSYMPPPNQSILSSLVLSNRNR